MPTVMVADDSMFQRFTLSKMLKSIGFDVTEAKDGQECLDMLDRHPPDALLLDLNMPVRNGFEILEALHSKGANIPVIVISADIQESSRKRCLELGARVVLGKPVKEEVLIMQIKDLAIENRPG